ncbi:hypothetical protein HN011_010822 [Eciton burchellii]|nr:hypothetical protein HN011_010822 [Eciton burchellii]
MAIAGSNVFPLRVEPPKAGQIRELYEQFWGTTGTDGVDPSKDNASYEIGVLEMLSPIREWEFTLKLRRMTSSVAAVPDGIKKTHLRQAGAVTVPARIMNACRLRIYYPKMWRDNARYSFPSQERTPVMSATIGSPLARIYSGIFDRRLRQFVSFADKQIGFTNLDGCKAYINLLGKAISCMRADSGRVITIVDIAMAFDTIPHAALKQCLQRKGVSERVASFPGLMYNDSWTTIRMGTSHSIKFQLKRGVNQGNPYLSSCST